MESANEYGKMIFNVSRLKDMSGKKKVGNVLGIVPRSPIDCNFTPEKSAIVVIMIMAMSGAGIIFINLGITYTNIKVTAANMYVIIPRPDRKSTRLNSSHVAISYAVFCLKKQ